MEKKEGDGWDKIQMSLSWRSLLNGGDLGLEVTVMV